MTDEIKRSPGGSQLLHHRPAPEETVASTDTDAMAAIVEHFAGRVGPVWRVFHEIISDRVHLDVHIISPTPERDRWTLFTTGMSDRPMRVPAGLEHLRFAELMISLPSSWQLSEEAIKERGEKWYWPMRWLKTLARLPHDYGTWLGMDHTIPNGDPAMPMSPGTKLAGWLIVPATGLGDEGFSVMKHGDREILIYEMIALHPAEIDFKLKHGSDALCDLLDEHGVTPVLDPERKPVTKRKLFGLF